MIYKIKKIQNNANRMWIEEVENNFPCEVVNYGLIEDLAYYELMHDYDNDYE